MSDNCNTLSRLDSVIEKAIADGGKPGSANAVYLTFFKEDLFVPIDPSSIATESELESDPEREPFKPLFVNEGASFYMMAFDSLERLSNWAGDAYAEMGHVMISGQELARGIGTDVYLCLNYGTPFYKQFSPQEMVQLKNTLSRIENIKKTVKT